MVIIHSHWLLPVQPTGKGCLVLWAETSDGKLKKPRGRPRVPTHVFVLSPDQLAQTLQPFASITADASASFAIILPAVKNLPIPSPGLIHDWDEFHGVAPTGLRRYKLDGLFLEPATALYVLNSLPAPGDLPPHLAFGDDLRFWITASQLALEMLAAQRYTPAIERVDTQTFHARWKPVFDRPDDATRLSQLLQAMPPSARACLPIELSGDSDLDLPPAHRLLEDFLTTLIDAAVREWHGAHWQTQRGDDVAVAWLNALFAVDPVINGPYFSISTLNKAHKTWVRQLHAAGDGNFRTCLQLGVPDTPEQPWPLDFLLQASDDPSLLVDAQTVWKSRGQTFTYLDRRFEPGQSTRFSWFKAPFVQISASKTPHLCA